MVLAGPETDATAFSNGLNMGRCDTDILTGSYTIHQYTYIIVS